MCDGIDTKLEKMRNVILAKEQDPKETSIIKSRN